MQLTQARLKELLYYDQDTGVFNWIASRSGIKASSVAGSKVDGYIRITVDGNTYKAHRLAWLYMKGYFPEHDLDHEDRIKHHNWIDNLREVSRSCNQRNTGNPSDNTSGVKGVYWFKASNKWQAKIMVSGKSIHLGFFFDFLEAVCHRIAAEQAENWSGCDNSSPAYKYVQEHIIPGGKPNVE